MKKYHHCVKFTYPLSFQTRIPKVDQHTGGKWLIQWCLDYPRIYASLGLNELIRTTHEICNTGWIYNIVVIYVISLGYSFNGFKEFINALLSVDILCMYMFAV